MYSDHSVPINLIDGAMNDILLFILSSDNFIKFYRSTFIGTVRSIASSFKSDGLYCNSAVLDVNHQKRIIFIAVSILRPLSAGNIVWKKNEGLT